MKAKIISIINQKGGAGKTTITMQLAAALSKIKKLKVMVIDADPQSTATRWASSADEDSPFPAAVVSLGVAGKKIHQEVQKLVNDYDIILIDCPPAIDSEAPQSALIISDLTVIPVIPSPADLWATVGIKKLIRLVEPINSDLQKMIVMNMCQANSNINKEVTEAVREMDIPLASTTVGHRTAFRKSAAYGMSVFDLGSEAHKACEEIISLSKEVCVALKLSGGNNEKE